jgi:twinkle protein
MGKSTLMNSIVGNCLRYNFPVCVASFETDVKPILVNGLRIAIMRCGKQDLINTDTTDADDILRSRLRIITQSVDEDAEMTLEAFLEYCRIAVTRDGVKMIVLDPWNEVEHKRNRDETETDYISRCLRMVKRFAKQYDVAFWIIAHPTKPQEGHKKIPGLYDISGSANWANKADYGLTYHRPDPNVNRANILVTKVRMGLPGKKGMINVSFDFRTSEFVECE